MRVLAIIPARGGSKGLPGKNIRPLCGKPLICYSIDAARSVVDDCDICVTTDDNSIIKVVENYGLKVPFIRPSALASDQATTNDVLIHALDFYRKQEREYDVILLLQPTSPLRTYEQIKQAIKLYNSQYDMVVSVRASHAASVLCHETVDGFLRPTLTNAQRRQDSPTYYEYNGAIYVITVNSLLEKGLAKFDREKKYIMPFENSVDIDNLLDFQLAEFILADMATNYCDQ